MNCNHIPTSSAQCNWTREKVRERALGAPSACRRICHGHLNAVVCKLCQTMFSYVQFQILTYSWKTQQWPVTLQVVTTKSVTRSFPSLVQGKVAMIPTCWIPPEAFPLLQKIVLRRCDWAGWWICIEWSLNGSKTQMTYESYDINRTSGSDTDQLVWPLHKSSALCVGHGCRMLRVEHCRRFSPGFVHVFLWKSTLNLQHVTPPSVFCTVQGRQKPSKRSMNKNNGVRLV